MYMLKYKNDLYGHMESLSERRSECVRVIQVIWHNVLVDLLFFLWKEMKWNADEISLKIEELMFTQR